MNHFIKLFKFSGSAFILFLFMFGCQTSPKETIFTNPHNNIEELAVTSEDCILEGRHLWVSNEIQTVNPDFTGIGGIAKIYSPPWNLSSFRMETRFFDQKVKTSVYTWKPGEITQEAEINNIGIRSLLIPLYPETKVIQIIELTNFNPGSISVPVSISADPLFSYEEKWHWDSPVSDKKATMVENDNSKTLCYMSEDGGILIGSGNKGFVREEHMLAGSFDLKSGEIKQFSIIISYAGGENIASYDPANIREHKLIEQSRKRYNERIESAYNRVGRIKSSNPALDLFYKRSILTLLTCEWNKNEMIMQPYFSESGIDGGAVCTYLWGFAYVSKIMPLYNPDAWKEHIIQGIKTDAMNHYAFTPITGSGTGPWYSYNQYSTVRTIYDYVHATGDYEFLNEAVDGQKVIDYCIGQALYKDNINEPVKLINYGTNENLLELKKTGTYQFYVPSPNAERCWSYIALDKLCALAGVPELNLSERAVELAQVITRELWSENDNWFLTRDTLGKKYFSPSIQIFDMLRCGVLSKEQEEGILSHLNENEFLSEYGVHSLSKLDPGYDLNDADWGGPGVYTGDAPELIEDLYFAGYPERAEDLLARILWWGKYLPYYPQAIIADDIDYRRNGRANIIAGITATQSILFGVLGLEFTSDGKASIKPLKNNLYSALTLNGLYINGESTNINIIGEKITITIGDRQVRGVVGEKVFF